jgi:hypothetical protein
MFWAEEDPVQPPELDARQQIERALGPGWSRLAAEFHARPLGPHGRELHWLLVLMRRADHCLNLVLVQSAPGQWVMAERRPHGVPPLSIDGATFDSLEAAERFAFRLRWRAMTGEELDWQ